MDEDNFHQKMEGNDLTYSSLFNDKEFLNEDWHNYTCIVSCAAIGVARHGCESLGTDIQSIREIDDSGCMLTNITGSSILKSTDQSSQVKPGKLSNRFILSDRELTAMGKSIQFPKPESEIRFGWGISYNYIGQMHHNLNKYDVVVGLETPDFRVISYYQPFSRDPKYCNKWNTGIRTKLLFETCQKIWPAYIGTISKLENSQERIKHIMEKEIPAVVPDFKLRPAPTEITESQPNVKRVKRFITDLFSLGIQGFSAFYQNKKQNKLKKGMEKLFERQNRLDNRVSGLDNDMISLARTTLKGLDHFQKELVRQGEHIKHLTNRMKHGEMAMQHHEH